LRHLWLVAPRDILWGQAGRPAAGPPARTVRRPPVR